MSKIITPDELARQNTAESCWIAIHGKVYDVTSFLADHPGGKKVLVNEAGKEATKKFDMFHKPDVLKKYGDKLIVGELAGSGGSMMNAAPEQQSAPAAQAPRARSSGAPSSAKSAAQMTADNPNFYGELVPYGDPNWYQGWNSPHYNDSHRRFRAAMREWVDKHITPFCHEWDEAKAMPKDFYRRAYEAGWLPGVVGSYKWPTDYVGDNIIGGVKASEWDVFHEQILIDECCRCGSGGVIWAMFGGLSIGLPPVMRFASQELRDKVVKPCLTGEKVICLAITEPYAGSDVAGLRTSAVKTPDGKHYIVNGEKKVR